MPAVGLAEDRRVGLQIGAVAAPDRAVIQPEPVAKCVFLDLREISLAWAELRSDPADRTDGGDVPVEVLPGGDRGGFRGAQERFGRRSK